jgi:hypothetical protein
MSRPHAKDKKQGMETTGMKTEMAAHCFCRDGSSRPILLFVSNGSDAQKAESGLTHRSASSIGYAIESAHQNLPILGRV